MTDVKIYVYITVYLKIYVHIGIWYILINYCYSTDISPPVLK
jgi:hypothetical protein